MSLHFIYLIIYFISYVYFIYLLLFIQASGEPPVTDIVKNKKLKQRAEVQALFAAFIEYNPIVRNKFVRRLREIRHKFESSRFFETHEVINL